MTLDGADLSGASLHGAEFSGASLRGAILVRADLSSAKHLWGDLAGADLRHAKLGAADMRLAENILEADLTGAMCDPARTVLPSTLKVKAAWSSSTSSGTDWSGSPCGKRSMCDREAIAGPSDLLAGLA